MRRRPHVRRGFTLIELMIVVAIIGLLAAIAVPNFIRFQRRAKRSEVRANLAALFTAEKGHFAERDTYTNSMERIGFQPERGNRYAYKLTGACSRVRHRTAASETMDADYRCIEVDTFKYPTAATLPASAFNAAVLNGSTGSFVASASGNLDNDDSDFDQWSVASYSRDVGSPSSTTACAEGPNAAGEPCLDHNDI